VKVQPVNTHDMCSEREVGLECLEEDVKRLHQDEAITLLTFLDENHSENLGKVQLG